MFTLIENVTTVGLEKMHYKTGKEREANENIIKKIRNKM